MRVLFDISNPKEVLFFKPMIEGLRRRGCLVRIVSRRFAECNILLQHFGLNATILGRHGGRSLQGKLIASATRVRLLARFMADFRPDVVVNFSNPESTRAAYGLDIPVVCFNDIPEAEHQTRLTAPFAAKILTPFIVPKRAFARYGVNPDRVYRYNALDPLIWLKDYQVDPTYLDKIGIPDGQHVIVWRKSETKAAYLKGKSDIVGAAVASLRRHNPSLGWRFIHIPRYRAHPIYDLPSLLASADLFIGGGGTLNIEAAFFGTPVICCRPLKCRYIEFLCKAGLAVEGRSVGEVVSLAKRIIERGERNMRRAQEVFGAMEFPLEEVLDIIVKVGQRRT